MCVCMLVSLHVRVYGCMYVCMYVRVCADMACSCAILYMNLHSLYVHRETSDDTAAGAARSEALMSQHVRYLDPFDIHLTHDRISPKFRNGQPLDDDISALLSGYMSPDAFPPLQVVLQGSGELFSLSNRLLFVYA